MQNEGNSIKGLNKLAVNVLIFFTDEVKVFLKMQKCAFFLLNKNVYTLLVANHHEQHYLKLTQFLLAQLQDIQLFSFSCKIK